jgi:hypothetical protein
MPYTFGQDITFWYYPLLDDTSFSPTLATPTPNIFVFSARPSRSDAEAGPGDVGSPITSMSWDAGKKAFSFTIPAIDDPDPDSETRERTYWVAINHSLQSAEQTQCVVLAFTVERVRGHQTEVGTDLDDLKSYFPQVGACASEADQLNFIEKATNNVRDKLKGEGYSWANIHRPDRLRELVALRALSLILLIQIQQGNDKFKVKYDEFKGMFQDAFDAIVFEYDSDGDGEADTDVRASNDTLILLR